MFKIKLLLSIYILSISFINAQEVLNYQGFLDKQKNLNQVTLLNKEILAGLEAPILSAPPNKSIDLSLTYNFNWAGSVGATKYWFQIAKDSAFTDLFEENKNATDQNIIIQTMDPVTKFYWRVCGKTNFETGPWSEVWTFTTRAALPLVPKLVLPENAIALFDNNADLEWTKSSYSKTYHLQISKTVIFENDSIIFDKSDIDTNIYKIRDNKLVPLTQYYWRVRGVNAKGSGNWSETRYFITGGKTSIEEELESQISLSPNPSNDYLNVSIPNNFNLLGIDVLDLQGRLILQNKTCNLNVNNLINGLYTLIIKSDKYQIHKTFIKK
ncbi:MAG: T9SS type A sorting domain-containing protein [Candidatus Kapabacteria bacterium]|nr:T9SS type A sorting domain-containing protein [Candidatus Kapabacteria bacterium]